MRWGRRALIWVEPRRNSPSSRYGTEGFLIWSEAEHILAPLGGLMPLEWQIEWEEMQA
ncbi:MAG: hypothetical protein KatS3mg057_1243 [Herpetosiphonaceae bacterium]|nr:MAG: hypothetical protein KatS3mg057_1243 [Herpetosiphonaceae bacterium]